MDREDRVAVPDFFGVVAGVIAVKNMICPCRFGFDLDNTEAMEAEMIESESRDHIASPGCYAIYNALVVNTNLETRVIKSLFIHHFQSDYVLNDDDRVIITGNVHGLDGPSSAVILEASVARFEDGFKPESDFVQFMLKTIKTCSMIAKALSMRDGFQLDDTLESATEELGQAFMSFNGSLADGFGVKSYVEPPLMLNFKPPELAKSE